MQKKIVLLGSGELGKEFVIAVKRLGHYVVAVDSYNDAPAQQVADEREVINMLDGAALDAVMLKHKPDIVVPEIEAIRTERFYDYEKQGIQVVPSAKAANFTMNRKAIRDLAAKELGLKTAKYEYANSLEELIEAVTKVGMPCVVKPLMSSSGKGQSVIKTEPDIEKSWSYAQAGKRGDYTEVIVEAFVKFNYEITLLTVTQKNGSTLFCPPIGHRQAEDGVYFSELSPRPHDTGMVTLAGTQNFSEFELHARAVLGLPIPEITLERVGASAVILADKEGISPTYKGVENAMANLQSDLRIFGKPTMRPYRRMAVALTYDVVGSDVNKVKEKAIEMAKLVKVS